MKNEWMQNCEDYKTRRTKDEKDEKIVAQYLDKYFYPNWTMTSTRCTDKQMQCEGLDITVVDSNGEKITIDEKAATRWIGRSLSTFSHEISSIDTVGREYDGWLLDFKSKSEYLLEVWIDDAKDTKLNDYTDITDATIALVPKKNIWNYLRKNQITSSELKAVAEEMRTTNKPYRYLKNFKLTQQTNQQEHAANILIPRNTIINLLSSYAVRIKGGRIITLRKAF